MRNSGINKDRIAHAGVERHTIGAVHLDIRIFHQVLSRTGRQRRIDLAGNDGSGKAHNFRHDGGEIAHAAAQVENAIARLQVERAHPGSQRTWLAIAQVARGIKRDGDVVINVASIGRRCGQVLNLTGRHVWHSNLPGARAQKVLARHAGEGLDQCGRVQVGSILNLIRIKTAALVEGHGLDWSRIAEPCGRVTRGGHIRKAF